MAKRKELTFEIYLNGEKVDKFSDEQKAKMSENLSKNMSEYYAQKIMKAQEEQRRQNALSNKQI